MDEQKAAVPVSGYSEHQVGWDQVSRTGRHIFGSHDVMDAGLDRLEKLVIHLTERLDPVLVPVEPDDRALAQVHTGERMSPMAMRLDASQLRASQIADRLDSIIDRIDL